jgi:type I restriction enzyme M protein
LNHGVLTNSTLQYTRDWIAENFRIVAIVSMPQTAFTATGAGVKSSVMFLRKYKDATIQKVKDEKASLQDSIKEKHSFIILGWFACRIVANFFGNCHKNIIIF